MPFFGGGATDYKIVGTNIKGSPTSLPAVVGGNNIGLGVGALPLIINGIQNIAVGNGAGTNLIDSNGNILIGYLAGNNLDETSNSNVLLNSFGNSILSPISDSIAIKGSVSGDNAISMGRSAVAGALAVAIGQGSNAPDNTVCIGNSANSSANYSVLIGDSLVDGGVVSVLIGDITARNVRIGVYNFAAYPPLQTFEESAVAVTAPNDLVENTVVTFTVPANTLRANSLIKIANYFSHTLTGNCTIRLKANGATILTLIPGTGNTTSGFDVSITNKNNIAANLLSGNNWISAFFAAPFTPIDTTIDFSADVTFTITVQKTVAGNAVVMNAFNSFFNNFEA